ncbi:Uu.00g086260.m01.CDS01 [Anthostomella pinea]|uniref:Uu.00g086260.m01.CDS01 n=1 Tax=Anthostomella pinea TaxID=933095 RepID=A0AAI8YJV6_9PEZI|nr:Uu.00g086260.m01.CDS01 [Anthostomella pinea]
MKPAFAATLSTLFTSLASAGVVITTITPDQVVAKSGGDCFFGVATPSGMRVSLYAVDLTWKNSAYLVRDEAEVIWGLDEY